MPLTDQDIRALTFLAKRVRDETCASNSRARQWDEDGTYANIAKVRHMHLADVTLSTIRAADDPAAQTPGVIANTQAPNWQERGTRPVEREPYDRHSFCGTCGQTQSRCESNPHADHTFETAEQRDARVARDRANRQETNA